MDHAFAPIQDVAKRPAVATFALRRASDFGQATRNTALQRPPMAGPFQTKLAISSPGDIYEQEADRLAERVMRMPAPQEAACDGAHRCDRFQADQPGRDGERVQARSTGLGGMPGAEALPGVEEALRAPGQPLDAATRAFMEPRFGHDFSRVRVHSDAAAARSASALNAQAYTVGQDIVFGMERFMPGVSAGQQLLAHELAHVIQQTLPAPGSAPAEVQRKCHADELGSPAPDCTPSQAGSAGWQFLFKLGCDDLLPGEEAKLEKLKPGRKLKIHGFASREGDPGFNMDLSCHRANRIAELARAHRADCPIVGTFKHGASPVSAPGLVPDLNPPDFWRSVIVEEVEPGPEPGEIWLDPAKVISLGWALYNRAQRDPTRANLDVVAARRAQLRSWLENTPKTLAPAGAQLTRLNLDEYQQFNASAEKLWTSVDQLLVVQKHPDAAKDTYGAWVGGEGADQGSKLHAKNVPAGARYHIDIFGEGYFRGAINIGDTARTTTTGVHGTPVPNLILRHFSAKDGVHIPIGDHVADLVTSENGPVNLPGLAEEIARIVAPGGIIVLYNPENMEPYHDKVAKATGGTITKTIKDRAIESRIVVPVQ